VKAFFANFIVQIKFDGKQKRGDLLMNAVKTSLAGQF